MYLYLSTLRKVAGASGRSESKRKEKVLFADLLLVHRNAGSESIGFDGDLVLVATRMDLPPHRILSVNIPKTTLNGAMYVIASVMSP